MIYYKTKEEIELLRQSNLLVSKTLAHVASILKPGITGTEIDRSAEEFIRSHEGAIPGFKGLYDFPNTLCVSINDEVVHGTARDIEFTEKDIVSIDCGVLMNEFYGDAAYTFAFNEVSEDVMKLLVVTKEALNLGVEAAKIGNRIGDISFAIQNYTERVNGYGVVRELVGHGVGRKLHEDPNVPNFGIRGRGPKLKEGLVIAIEPMINMGKKHVVMLDNDIVGTKDKLPSAHYEHTVSIGREGGDRLSTHSLLEEEIKKNPEIREIALK